MGTAEPGDQSGYRCRQFAGASSPCCASTGSTGSASSASSPCCASTSSGTNTRPRAANVQPADGADQSARYARRYCAARARRTPARSAGNRNQARTWSPCRGCCNRACN
ncbi:MAG: hypothetical protein WC359_13130 [Dehalococcoidia bacterium]